MEIKRLAEAPEFMDTVIEWLNHEFGTKESKKFYEGIIVHSVTEAKLPTTFVAVEEGKLLGTVGIWKADLLSRQDLFPWMSALVVNPKDRNKGIGQALQTYAVEYCRKKGYKELYLYTDLEGYYEKSGWIPFEKGYEYTGEEMQIYKKIL